MAKSKSLEKAVDTEVKEAAHEAKTGNVVTQDIAHRQKLEDDRAAGADLPTGQRRDHPPA